jgi:phosphatidylglycerol:prolipoprotein diacylglycerol transferase
VVLILGRIDPTVQAHAVFATYVHDLDPVIFEITKSIALRWYGLAYLAGFVLGYVLLKRLAEKKLWVLEPEKTADFIAAAALLGVFIGGRLGYVLFYQIPRDGLDSVLHNPLGILKVWEGGMASHGGILGLMIFTFFYARKHKISWTGLGDGLCVVAPLGLMFGRMANFINGELYGRIANGVPWAVKFPNALSDGNAPESGNFNEAFQSAFDADPEIVGKLIADAERVNPDLDNRFQLLAEANRESDAVNQAIEPFLEPRHPSQLYEGILEGGLLFGILWFVRIRFPQAPHGLLTGLFFGLYATFRIFAEQFREPDAAWVIDGILTKGQFLSIFMYVFSAAFLGYAYKTYKQRKALSA